MNFRFSRVLPPGVHPPPASRLAPPPYARPGSRPLSITVHSQPPRLNCARKDGAPFGIAGIWENWKEPASSEWIRTFAIITTDSNELVAEIHDRMPVILVPANYARWLGEEPDPRDLMRPFPAHLMRMWPISTRVNKPENDDPSIIEPIEPATDVA